MTDDSTTSSEPSAAAETSGESSPKTPPRAPRSPRSSTSSTARNPAAPRTSKAGAASGDGSPNGSTSGGAAKKPRAPRASPASSSGEAPAPRAPRRPAGSTAKSRTPAAPRAAAKPRTTTTAPATAAEKVVSPREVAAPAVADPLPDHVAAAVVVPPRPPLPEPEAADPVTLEALAAPTAVDGVVAEEGATERPATDDIVLEASAEDASSPVVDDGNAGDAPTDDVLVVVEDAGDLRLEGTASDDAPTTEIADVVSESVAIDVVDDDVPEVLVEVEGEGSAATAGEDVPPAHSAALGFGPAVLDGAAPALEVRGLVKRFGDEDVVHGIDLVVPAGTFYGIVGPNGAGKTTTLSMIAGLLRADSGEILVNGLDSRDRSRAVTRLVGVLPDRFRTFDRLTGRQLLYYCGVLRGLDAATTERRAADLARAFDLVDALGRPVADYSAGMTKKVLLAGALIHAPRLLVLDEPFEAVDPMSAAAILEILGGYVAHGGTVLLSSHGMELVERVCSRVAILVDGRIVADGTLDEVRGEGTLEERFIELTGGAGEAEGLEWLRTFSG